MGILERHEDERRHGLKETIPVDSSSSENITRTSKPPDEVAIHTLSTA
jgi:hypothetical protein